MSSVERRAPAPEASVARLRARIIWLHRSIAIIGGLTLVLWGASGLIHVSMSMFGPQPAKFFPPQRAIDLSSSRPLEAILAEAGVARAAAVKVIVGEGETLLQVTETQDAPRRYFRLADGAELANHDARHAVFLARYFTGAETEPVAAMTRITAFSEAYPAVNRLLPVYRVEFDRPDRLTAYVYTETNALASLTNRRQATLLTAFQWIHTWSWMPRPLEGLRVALMAAGLVTLILMAVSGLVMLALIRRSGPAPGVRGWHRIAGYILWLPILALAGSGLFHLIVHSGPDGERTLTLSPPLELAGAAYPIQARWDEATRGLEVNSLSLVQSATGGWFYRLALAGDQSHGPQGHHEMRHARFDGRPRQGEVVYLDAATGAPWAGGDRAYAIELGERFTRVGRAQIEDVGVVTGFGEGYDFRNKRLPVWRLDYGAPVNATVYVDTASGVLADVTPDAARPELVSFAYAHKWGFLAPLGRDVQNITIGAVVSLCLILMGVMGLQMDLKRRGRGRGRPRK